MEPQPGIDYRLELGPSLLNKRPAGEPPELCTLRFDFKPQSAARATQGQLDVNLASQKVRRHSCRLPSLLPPGGCTAAFLHPACCAAGSHATLTPPLCPAHVHSVSQVSLQMGEATFTGKWEPAKGDGLDAVAIFDGTSFRLELLGASVKSLK